MVGLLVDLLVGCCFVGWLAGWLAGWLVGCWLVGWTVFLILEASFYYPEACILHLGHHLGDLGVHWDTKGDSLGSRVGFPLIFSGFGEPVGS